MGCRERTSFSAIAMTTAEHIASRLIREGKVRRSTIGIGGQTVPLSRRVVRFYDLPADSGLLVVSVEPGSPAAQAGLVDGDVIIAFGGVPVGGIDALVKLLTKERVGVATPMSLIRGGTRRIDAVITPGAR